MVSGMASQVESSNTSQWNLKIKLPEWFYFRLELQTIEEEREDEISLDVISWKLLITAALKKFQGILGQSVEYDILQNKNKGCIVRVHTEDKDMFSRSLVAYIADLSTFGLGEAKGSVKISDRSQFLSGVTGPDRFADFS